MCPDSTGEGASEKGQGQREEEGRERKSRRHDGRKGRKEGMRIQMGGIAPLLLEGIDATAKKNCRSASWARPLLETRS